ncbi:hypothetical protein J6590_023501 [Homalodisca vitripennis]|nr:hypothetical protein J6590_023501 [Homalodisca vitripennis]
MTVTVSKSDSENCYLSVAATTSLQFLLSPRYNRRMTSNFTVERLTLSITTSEYSDTVAFVHRELYLFGPPAGYIMLIRREFIIVYLSCTSAVRQANSAGSERIGTWPCQTAYFNFNANDEFSSSSPPSYVQYLKSVAVADVTPEILFVQKQSATKNEEALRRRSVVY